MYQTKYLVTVSANTVLQLSDSGTHYIANGSGAINFTLPQNPSAQEAYFVFTNRSNQNMVIGKSSGVTLVTVNNANATSFTYSTTNQLIGACAMAKAIGENIWSIVNLSTGCTGTVA